MKLGLKVVKFFPAGIYGGLSALKALAGPFAGIKFIPTGGVNTQNIGEFIAAPFVHAVGGSWVCPKTEIDAGNFEKITELCIKARQNALGYEIAHVGINADNCENARNVVGMFGSAFDFAIQDGRSSTFVSSNIEVMKAPYLGRQGHLAVRTNSIALALEDLEKKGLQVIMDTAKYRNDRLIAVYLKDEIAGFAIHLLQK